MYVLAKVVYAVGLSEEVLVWKDRPCSSSSRCSCWNGNDVERLWLGGSWQRGHRTAASGVPAVCLVLPLPVLRVIEMLRVCGPCLVSCQVSFLEGSLSDKICHT